MLVFTVGLLLLVRISLVYGAEVEDTEIDHEMHSLVYGAGAGEPPYQTRLTVDTFEWLKTVVLITQRLQHNQERNFHLSTLGPGTSNDILVEKALGAWATAIKQQMVWESEATLIAEDSIVCSQQETAEILGPVIVWKAATSWDDFVMTDHLIIRQVNNSDTYEWMEVSQPNPKYSLSRGEPFRLWPMRLPEFLTRWTFTADGSGAKRLTEICSAFAEQQIQKWHYCMVEMIQEMQEHLKPPELDCEKMFSLGEWLAGAENELYSLFEDLQGIAQRERDRQIPNEENKKQLEEQLRNSEAERSSMVAQLEASRIREENQQSQREAAQTQLEESRKAAADAALEFNRKEKETNHWIMIAALIGGSVLLVVTGILIFVLCRKAGKRIIDNSEEMKRELGVNRERKFQDHPLPHGQPGSVVIDVAEMDPRFRCSRDPQVAALRHSVLADENAQFGINQIDEVTEQEGIDVSAVTRQSTLGNAEEGESVIQAIKEGVKEAIERKQKRQMHVEPLKEIMQNAVVVQDEVIAEIVEVMETDKAQEPESAVDQ